MSTDIKEKIESANEEAVKRMNAGDPVLVDIAAAGEVIPGLKDKMILHSGPPIDWARMCGAQRGAMIGVTLFEGWAKDAAEAERLLASSAITFEPNHHHQTVGPMAGTISKSMPVWVVENKAFGNRAFCRQVEGRQQFGDYSDEALNALRLWRDVWAPTLRQGLQQRDGLPLKPIIAKALQMGDEMHNRCVAASSLFANALMAPMIQAGVPKDKLLATIGLVTNHELIFLALAMAAGKAIADPARDLEHSTVVVAMARNGTEFGIRVSGLGDEWFTAPSPKVEGLYLPGFKDEDAGRDMGDSAITETVGWGGFVLAGATGILALVGGTPEQAMTYSREMRQITTTLSTNYRMPVFGFEGTPVGIDIRKVVQTGITPIIDTAMAHKNPGYPIIGAGLVRPPIDCFKKALARFGEKYHVMATGCIVRKNEFFDSVFLMRVAKRITEQPGVQQSAALMATEKNKELLADIGVTSTEIDAATPNDLIIAVVAENEQIVRTVLDHLDDWLRHDQTGASEPAPRTLDAALARQPNANLAVISVPGEYAAREARRALEQDLNVFLFSSNVAVADELALKRFARERGLIVMGPDCGTAIISGIGIGFANVVRRGPIGVIGAAGTGLQEFTTLAHHAGSGISHAIGVGGRDLSDALGGISALSALEALERDTATKVIAIVSKPPGANTLTRLIERIGRCNKPVVACFLGIREELPGANIRFRVARTLDDAAMLAVQIITGKSSTSSSTVSHQALISSGRARLTSKQKYIRGIFAGGTFCYQAQQVLRDTGLVAHSNAPIAGNVALADARQSVEHTLVDMGSEEFTAGRPHPMIDASLRRERILAEARDPQVVVLLLDFILGYNASPEPVGDLIDTIVQAQDIARARGGCLPIVASVCGTEGDPQGLQRQIKLLEDAGVVVLPSSAQTARFAALVA